MNTLYTSLVVIHILSAIIGIGPGFVLTTLVKTAHTLTQIRFVFALKKRVHQFVKIGGVFLLVSGLLLGWISPVLFQQGWFVTSLLLYVIILLLGATLLKGYSAPIRNMIADPDLQSIPSHYYVLRKRLLRAEYFVNMVIIVIILLMVLKPF